MLSRAGVIRADGAEQGAIDFWRVHRFHDGRDAVLVRMRATTISAAMDELVYEQPTDEEVEAALEAAMAYGG